MPRGIFEDRYLRAYEGGIQVRIVRLGVNYSRKFHYRIHGGEAITKAKARRHRNRIYQEIFGEILVDSSHLLKPRGGSGCPPGISEIKDIDGMVIAHIISWQTTLNETGRHYLPIANGGIPEAVKYRVDRIAEKYISESSVS